MEMSAGQARVPPVIFTVKLHVVIVFPDVSVAVQTTVLVPTGKAEPENGSQVTKPQLPDWVGDG